jgi:surface protein
MFRRATLVRNVDMTNVVLNTSANIDMSLMFIHDSGGSSLTGLTGLNTWNTSKVNNTSQMFQSCTVLPSLDLSGWIMTANTNTSQMFQTCSVLTGLTVSNWSFNTSTATTINMNTMFSSMGTKTITGLDTWNITRVTNFTNFLQGTTLDTTTYSNMLIAWDILDPVNSLAFYGGGSKYNAAGQVARASLVTNDLWSITDGGLA